MGSQEQPRALEQLAAQPTVQSMSLYVHFCMNNFHTSDAHLSLTVIYIYFCMAAWLDLKPYIFCYLASKSKSLPHTDCVHLFVYFQLFRINMDYSKLKKDGPDF